MFLELPYFWKGIESQMSVAMPINHSNTHPSLGAADVQSMKRNCFLSCPIFRRVLNPIECCYATLNYSNTHPSLGTADVQSMKVQLCLYWNWKLHIPHAYLIYIYIYIYLGIYLSIYISVYLSIYLSILNLSSLLLLPLLDGRHGKVRELVDLTQGGRAVLSYSSLVGSQGLQKLIDR